MKEKYMVRIIKNQLENFKNVKYGEIKYMNYSSVNKYAVRKQHDIVGIYGQNGSGKTAMIEALDILKTILSGTEINYFEYEGAFSKDLPMKLTTTFFIEHLNNKYKAEYEVQLKKSEEEKRIQIYAEKLTYWQRGATWKGEKSIMIKNPFYNKDSILGNVSADGWLEYSGSFENISFIQSAQNLALYCSQKNISVFFNEIVDENLTKQDKEESVLSKVVNALFHFGRLYFQVVKVNQLGAINNNLMIPVYIHRESEEFIMQGCLPMFMKGHGEVADNVYEYLENAVDAINIALKAVIPNLSIALHRVSEEFNQEGIKMIQVDVYSIHDGKKFLIKYESEGIKRIISLLHYLISLYNYPEICLVVDELDSGVFEYLLGELLGFFYEEAEGQLIFTSHNLRILEKLDSKNIICSTVNPNNRYIRLTGVEKNNNHRDFYIRSLVLGGQKEGLYDDEDLQSMGYVFRKASRDKKEEELDFSSEFLNILKK